MLKCEIFQSEKLLVLSQSLLKVKGLCYGIYNTYSRLVDIVVHYLQLLSLASENKILVVKLKQTSKDPSQKVSLPLVPDHEVGTLDFICTFFICICDI